MVHTKSRKSPKRSRSKSPKKEGKTTLSENQAWCVKCRKAVKAHLRKGEIKKVYMLKGKCPHCETSLTKFCNKDRYDRAPSR